MAYYEWYCYELVPLFLKSMMMSPGHRPNVNQNHNPYCRHHQYDAVRHDDYSNDMQRAINDGGDARNSSMMMILMMWLVAVVVVMVVVVVVAAVLAVHADAAVWRWY